MGQLPFSNGGRGRLLSSLRSSEPRNGIAAAFNESYSASGENGNQYSSAAIINSHGRLYVLAVLTEGSNPRDVAELARQIDDFMRR
jgi:hypothetical protein